MQFVRDMDISYGSYPYVYRLCARTEQSCGEWAFRAATSTLAGRLRRAGGRSTQIPHRPAQLETQADDERERQRVVAPTTGRADAEAGFRSRTQTYRDSLFYLSRPANGQHARPSEPSGPTCPPAGQLIPPS